LEEVADDFVAYIRRNVEKAEDGVTFRLDVYEITLFSPIMFLDAGGT
jgi:hypothetical protein